MVVVEGTFSEKFTLKLWFLTWDMKDESDERRQPWNIWVVSVAEKRNNMFKYSEIEMRVDELYGKKGHVTGEWTDVTSGRLSEVKSGKAL